MVTTNDRSTVSLLKNAFQFALEKGYAISCWRLPSLNTIHLSFSYNEPVAKGGNIEKEIAGFYVSPFINPELNSTFFFKTDEHYIIEEDNITSKDGHTFNFNFSISTPFHTKDIQCKSTPKTTFIQSVDKALNTFENTELKKVIISKVKAEAIPPDLDITQKFFDLTQNYPLAFISLISSKTTGTWVGATPEILISIDKNNTFKTVALAGTQPNEGQNIKEAVWTQKEIEEQSFVSKYIIHCFKNLRLREFEDIGPKTVKAANLLHLKTEFTVNLKEVKFPKLGTQMLNLLHPTSAVCGTPKDLAQEFISQNENYDRSLFTGFLGPVNTQNETHLFVNLRCLQVTKNSLLFYAGAGITEDSNPEKEWMETEHKCLTLESIFLS